MIREPLILLQADLDDDTPENLSHATGLLLDAGALDCVRVPILMKKGRSGIRFEVLTTKDRSDELGRLLLVHTRTIGYRVLPVNRVSLERQEIAIVLSNHQIHCKAVFLDGKLLRIKAEFDDCAIASHKTGRPIAQIREQAERLAREELNDSP